ncbi:MAG: hypothetical protein GF364_18515 [Candidatus Lokiarchaeota archaeon]|nr:hypothetical protein [Candidatus Lokiarchaeota archaeon]
MEELKRQAMRKKQQELQDQQNQYIEQKKKAIMRIILSSDARVRLNNIKMVRKEFAESVEYQLIQLYQQGVLQQKFNLPMSDENFKSILKNTQNKRRDRKIRKL